MTEIILASESPRRKELLEQIGLDFKVVLSKIDENISELEGSFEEKAEWLALCKAKYVAESLDKGLVIGADTIVVVDDRIFGKPVDEENAFEMLSALSGREHRVITAISVVDAKNMNYQVTHEVTKVVFNKLSSDKVKAYIKTGEPMDKAGAYGIQEVGALLVKRIEGCYYNVVGLPLAKLAEMLENFGYEVLN